MAAGTAAAGPRARLRLSRRGFAALGLLVALLLGTAGWLVYFSPVLDVRVVSVSGTAVLTPAQVLAAARVPLGGPLERLDSGAVRARVLEALPRVAQVRVSTDLPHTVRLRITERVAVAAVRLADGGFTEVDPAGVDFATAPVPPTGVPVVELALSAAGRAALPDFPQSVLVNGAVRIARALPPALARETGVVVVHSYDDMELQLAGGATVLWGSPERDARKAVVLVALLKQKAATYNVTAPDDPALRS
ncbi:FtsQ-type POTRA domain-containing protein [Streptacidiphilus sp. 4-A2]|nr:FtsQ-type POTRA domain-containing protein [Streptacidiphilus sp. 4-A2]